MMGRALSVALMAIALGGCEHLPVHPLAKLDPAVQLPAPEGTYLNMGRHLLASNQIELARDAFIRSIRVEGMSAAALTGAGLASERQGLLHDALRYFQRAATVAPSSILAQNNLGAVLYRLGEYNRAKQAFQAAFALASGTNRVAEHNLGLADMALERERAADLALAPNPRPVLRLGTGEYTLPDPKNVEQEG